MPEWHMSAGQQHKENWQTLSKRASFGPIQAAVGAQVMTFVGMSFLVELQGPTQRYWCDNIILQAYLFRIVLELH
jgi:hypothetical protein